VKWREPVTTRDQGLPGQGYRLRIDERQVAVGAADDAGAFYARATLDQLRHAHGRNLPTGTITDWPDLPVRGVRRRCTP
jgi:hexosaminidase